mmetsp:Transcript_9467/g.19603  ORF Transcript_9467/g.19603 Transcript_9467/m.19603 type:complete len:271 (-) Transcript_9467:80-892(-)
MMTAPFLIQFFFTIWVWPQHAMMMSARFTSASGLTVRECTMETVASRFRSSMAAGMPTMLERPSTTACFPFIDTPLRSSSSMHPLGVQGTKSGSRPFMLRAPMLRGWKPSTSFSMLMALRMVASSMCLGRGSWTRMPCTAGSALKSCTTFRSSSWVTVSGSSLPKDAMPHSAHFFFFMLTYVCESPLVPTITTARPGTLPVFSFRSATSAWISLVIVAAISLPLITLNSDLACCFPGKGSCWMAFPMAPKTCMMLLLTCLWVFHKTFFKV